MFRRAAKQSNNQLSRRPAQPPEAVSAFRTTPLPSDISSSSTRPAKPTTSVGRQPQVAIPRATNHKATPPAPGLSIQINFPTIRRPEFKWFRAAWIYLRPQFTKPRCIGAGLVLIAAVVGLSLYHTIQQHHQQTVATGAISAGQAAASKPAFTPVVPNTHPNLAHPDTVHSGFDASRGTYSFIDTIASKQFTVSQQKLATAEASQMAVGKAAKSLNATVQLKTNWGTTYLVTNQKYNSQVLVFGVQDILVFIQSSSILTNDQWIQYINSIH